jgi:hypothetical protein
MTATARGTPWLSVVMPTYNGAEYLRAALDSVAGEGTDGLELLVVDDGSTDGTPELLREYARRLPLRIVSERRAGNWVAGTNLALRAAAGTYACFLHQDDLWLPGRLEATRGALVGSDVALLVHPAIFVDRAGKKVGKWSTPFGQAARTIPGADFVERLLVQNFLAVPAPVFRREVALGAGGLDERLWYTADWDLWLRLAAHGPVRHLPAPLAAFRVHAASQTMAPTRTRRDFEEQMSTVLERHFAGWASSAAPERARSVRRVAELSVRLNAALAAAARGERVEWISLAGALAALGPAGVRRYWRDSRIWERVRARRRVRAT